MASRPPNSMNDTCPVMVPPRVDAFRRHGRRGGRMPQRVAGNEERPQWSGGVRGRCRARTDDLFRVKEARYQLRQSPMWDCGADLIWTADSLLSAPGRGLHL